MEDAILVKKRIMVSTTIPLEQYQKIVNAAFDKGVPPSVFLRMCALEKIKEGEEKTKTDYIV